LPEELPPSREAVQAAIDALSAEERQRLKRFGYWRMARVTGRVRHADGDDLLQEAIARTLEGKRLWNPKHTFFYHLASCMSSIANELAKQGGRLTELIDPDFHPSNDENIQMELEVKAHIDRLRKRLQGDTVALEVLQTLLDGEPPREARNALKLQPNIYEAARKRISRAANQLFGPSKDKAR